MIRKIFFALIIFSTLLVQNVRAGYTLIPMDAGQTNHLKAYGIAYWVLQNDIELWWLLNYRGGSFMFKSYPQAEKELNIRGVSFENIADARSSAILTEIADPEVNMDAVKMEKAPKIAVYSPKDKAPWDDAVTLVLTYAEIPYDVIYDDEIMEGKLPLYNWLHLHHEDFTGQYGKFWSAYRNADWYLEQVRTLEASARKWGFSKVSHLKLAVSKEIQKYVAGGGFMFAMCSATDSYDIALSADGVDICEYMFDGDAMDPKAQEKLDFNKTMAFKDYTIVRNPNEYEYSNIDATTYRRVPQMQDFFTLFDFSAKWDPVPTMLTQCHERVIPGFMGQTTSFRKQHLKTNVLILGDMKSADEARYIHGEFGKGFFTFYGGHDPEDYQHMVYDPPTDLALFPNSAGYRLILNNVLFPAAKKKKQKT